MTANRRVACTKTRGCAYSDFASSAMTDSWLAVAHHTLAWASSGIMLRELIDRFDWSRTPIGAASRWSTALRTTLQIALSSRHAMCFAWGPELTFFYNDAYMPFLGARHPQALGLPMREVWPEIWDELSVLVDQAMSGEATS